LYQKISGTTAAATVSSTPVYLHALIWDGAPSGAISVYDGPTATGTLLYTVASSTAAGQRDFGGLTCETGLVVALEKNDDCVVVYQKMG